MNKYIRTRIINEAKCMLDKKNTIREIAIIFNVSKSTVHKDLSSRLRKTDNSLYLDIEKILKEHINIRHIRGGEATKKKYLKG